MKKKKGNNKSFSWIIIPTILIIIGMTIFILVYSTRENKLKRGLQNEGYTTTQEEAFYNKIVTNNTLDDYYNDIGQGKDTSFEQYYVSKESNNFIELKIYYKNKINTTLNITSELTTNKTNYNFELEYQDSHIIIDGNSDQNYKCNIVLKEKANDNTINYYFNLIKEEINSFLQKKEELLQKEAIKNNLK